MKTALGNLRQATCAALVLAGLAQAQFGPSTGSQNTSATPAAQLPLSGRTGTSSGSVTPIQTPIPGTTSSINTINSSVQTQGAFSGSVPQPITGPVNLTLTDAIQRGLKYNLGAVGFGAAVRQARGQQQVSRSSLLPNLNGNLRETVQQTNLQALGVRIPFAPTIVGPFNYFDLRATLTQTVADVVALQNYRASQQNAKAAEYAAQDARDLVVLAVSGAYLQVGTAAARIASTRAQVATAEALLKQATDRKSVGLVAQIDVNRARVQFQTQQQRLTTLENDLVKQRINLARLVGLPPGANLVLADAIPYAPAPLITTEDALAKAYAQRADLQAATAQVHAAERARAAARSERLPSLLVSADYGAIGTNPSQSHGTFTVTGSLRIPIYEGGRTEGNIAQAEAALDQRRAELADTRGRIEADIRNAFADLQSATSQVQVAHDNQQVARDTLQLTRQRLEAGITDIVEVTQAQESVATADQDYLSSVFAFNVAKVSLARAMGRAEQSVAAYLGLR